MREGERTLLLFSLASATLTRSLPARIASMVDTKQSSKTFLFFETVIGDFRGGCFQNKQLLNGW